MDSYLPRQISQSDCEIISNCGKKVIANEPAERRREAGEAVAF